MTHTAAIAGGGLAGCAAAVRLAERGWRVVLLERHPRLGGKVGGFRLPGGAAADNGQHVLTKACTALRSFLDRIGAAGNVRWQERLRLPFAMPGGRVEVLARGSLPAPWHLAPALLSFGAIPMSDRLAARHVLSAAQGGRGAPDGGTFRDWLRALGQSETAVRRLWEPLVLAVCNASVAEVSAAAGAWVVREGLAARSDALDLGIPAVPQPELFAPAVEAFLKARGGEVRTGASVEGVLDDGRRSRGVRLRGGEAMEADAVVLAVPWDAVRTLLPERLRGRSPILALAGLSAGAILSVALRLDRDVLPEGEGFVGLVDQPAQWAFAKEGHALGVVVSGANALAGRPGAEVVSLALRSLEACLPGMRGAKVLDAAVMKEKRATFLPSPGSEALRPGPDAAGLERLALAGAWTATGWPATMEGAVRSGERAAELLSG